MPYFLDHNIVEFVGLQKIQVKKENSKTNHLKKIVENKMNCFCWYFENKTNKTGLQPVSRLVHRGLYGRASIIRI